MTRNPTIPRTARPAARGTPGFTIIELMVALTVFGILVTATLSFISSQGAALAKGVDHMSAAQNINHVITTVEDDVLTLGTNLPADQPGLVYAGESVVAFNADYATNAANDLFSVYYEKDAPNGQVSALRSSITIPGTSFTYPDTVYETAAGTLSPAELLVLYFEQDDETSRSDDYKLMRQINDTEPEVLARNLLKVDGMPFFRYFRKVDFASSPSVLDSISSSDLPSAHSAAIHRSAADTGTVALVDQVRALRLTVASTNAAPGEHERIAELTRVIPMPNAGFTRIKTCGDEPLMGGALTAQVIQLPTTGDDVVQLTWAAATDEVGGEQDVIRYVVYRVVGVTPNWEDPYLGIAAGNSTYLYLDTDVEPGATYRYAVAAQDCTPSLSGLVVSSAVTLPASP